ncbi:MAG: MFS transporter [Alphaproteobacteria bacterium]
METEREETKTRATSRWPLAALALSMLLSSMGVSIANVALPTLAQAFAASFQAAQWVVLAYLLAVTVASVGAGRLGDLMGHRRVLVAGIAIFTAASALCAVAPTLPALIAARALQGTGAAILMALTIALVRDTVAKEKTGSAMGLLGTMSALGTALGPSLGGALIAGPGWRAIFFVMVPLGVLNFWLAHRHLGKGAARADTARPSFDALGTALLGVTLAAYALAMTLGRGQFGTLNIILLAASAAGLGAFLLAESKAKAPLLRLAAFRDAALSAGLAMNTVVATVMMTTLVVGPFYLSRTLGLGEALVGAVMSVGPVVSMFTGVPAGRIVDRWGAPSVMLIGLAAMAAGAFALAAIPSAFGIAGYVAGIALLTPGYQLFQAANNTAVMKDVAPDRRGVVSGMLSLSRNLGLITGASVMGAVFAIAAGRDGVMAAAPDDVGFGMRVSFAVAASLLLAALALAAGIRARGAPAAVSARRS